MLSDTVSKEKAYLTNFFSWLLKVNGLPAFPLTTKM